MPEENVTALEERITRASDPNFRNRLVSRGLARSMIWSGGVLPAGSPEFSPSLTSDLLAYGFTMLGNALRLREAGGKENLQRRAFELAAEALESIVRNGDPETPARGFHRIVAAAAYHLAHFSARSYSLVPNQLDGLNLSPAEYALALLIRRRLGDLHRKTFSWLTDSAHTDAAFSAGLHGTAQTYPQDETLPLVLHTIFHRALALFQYSIETGDRTVRPQTQSLFVEGEEVAQDSGYAPLWWIFILARHLTDDLWDHSLHVRLPEGPNNGSDSVEGEWRRQRRAYIALLACRNPAEIELWPSQLEAASRSLDITDDLVVSLPTSAGKTRIAELCILRALALGSRVVFVTPLRALSAQTERTLRHTFAELGFSVSSLYGANGAGPLDADALRHRNIVVSTPEKIDFALRNDPQLIDDVGLIVFDEGHMLGVNEREIRYEILIQALLRRTDATRRRIVCLSALLPEGPDLADFVAWLRQDVPGEPINCTWRPTRRRFGEVLWLGDRARFQARIGSQETFVQPFFLAKQPTGRRTKAFPKDRTELTLATAWRLVEDGKAVLIYCPERRSVTKLANEVLETVKAGYLPSLWTGNAEALQDALQIGTEWLGATHPAVRCLSLGVAVHHGQLPRPFQRAVEALLQAKKLSVTIASPTLAQGLNLSAHTLIFHAITRSGSLIPSSEFANVAGRAGRAFIDLEGQVLCTFYGAETLRFKNQWDELIREEKERRLSSGLALLVLELAQRLEGRLGSDLPTLVEYLCGNAVAWEAPALPEDNTAADREEKAFLKEWPRHVASLDCALLSLLAETESQLPEEELALRLDTVLTSSLWHRTLQRLPPTQQQTAKTLLECRAKFLWRHSTPQQRRGYFCAGIGLDTGKRLDASAATLHALLCVADRAIHDLATQTAIEALTIFAKIVFDIEPFSPKNLPNNWELVLAGWIRGESVSALRGNEADNDFIESTLVYRLAWALEAVRVRAVAHGEWHEQSSDGAAVAAIETGTHCLPCALLIQNGFASRIAALKIVEQSGADFKDLTGMRVWLRSTFVQEHILQDDWPTPETKDLWRKFVQEQMVSSTRTWREEESRGDVAWDSNIVPPAQNSPVRLVIEADGRCGVYTLSCQRLGTLNRGLQKLTGGILASRVGLERTSILTSRIGPPQPAS